ncbi:NACHT domain-containing protein, partial [Micromonospora zhanjiangensis]
QPGSGKSVLTRILAARLPAADFLVVRVALRDVPAAADLRDQIEQAVRADTGERLDWPALARSAGDALPVVLLDGFDELLQATGVNQTSYLLKVAEFQRREAVQGRPVVVLVTSRTSVADRAQPPAGTVALRLEPFDEPRVSRWVDTWNAANAGRFPSGVDPLDAATVLAHRELAEQPLLLLMLALYDADGNDLRSAGDLRRGELYERLLRSFARREVVKHRPDLSPQALDRAVEDELRRLAVVAFAMFNRRAQWVTEAELEADLAALPFGTAPTAAARDDLRTPLRSAEIVLGRFFFIHRSQASRDADRPKAYEFLHATFGEYLVARLTWQAVSNLVGRASADDMALGGGVPDDDLLHALLSYAVLTGRAPVAGFLREWMSTLDEPARTDWAALLVRLFRAARYATGGRRFDDYRPRRLPVPARHAAYSANLLLLAVCAGGTVYGRQLYPDDGEVVPQWHADALLWRSQLAAPEWDSLTNALELRRTRVDGAREIVLTWDDHWWPPDDGRVELSWSFDHLSDRAQNAGWRMPNQHPEVLRRKAHFECGANTDLVQHVLEPLAVALPETVNTLSVADGSRMASAAHLLLAGWLAPVADPFASPRPALYRRCAALTVRFGDLTSPNRRRMTRLLLDRLATDPDLPVDVAVDVLGTLVGGERIPEWFAGPALRCCLTFLGRDRTHDRQLAGLITTTVLRSDGDDSTIWSADIALAAMARLHELGVQSMPISDSYFDLLVRRYGESRPDLITRLTPLRTGQQDGAFPDGTPIPQEEPFPTDDPG